MSRFPLHRLAPALAYPLACTLLAAAGTVFAPMPAAAASWQFVQPGYAGDATVTGSFSGTDADGDGWLRTGELDDFSLSFSGNYAVPAFDLGLGDHVVLAYRIGETRVRQLGAQGPGDGLFQFESYDGPGLDFSGAPGRVLDWGRNVASATWYALEVTSAVPEASPGSMLAAGIAVMGLLARRRRAA